MRLRTISAPLALVAAALVLGGCTSSDTDGGLQADDSPSASSSDRSPGSSSPDAPKDPACADVWTVGSVLPSSYTGCSDGTAPGTQDVTECLDDTRLVVFEDSLWAVTGDEVVEPEASPLQDTEAYGAAFSACTGE